MYLLIGGTLDVGYDHEIHDYVHDAYADGRDYDCFPHQLLTHYGLRFGYNYSRLLFHAQIYYADVPYDRDACDRGACDRDACDRGAYDHGPYDCDACGHGARFL